MAIKRFFACILCLSLIACTIGAVGVKAVSACEVESMVAVYNTQTETVDCTVNYTGAFLPNQNYVFILSNGNGAQLTLRTVRGTDLEYTDSSFSYSFPIAQSVISSSVKPLSVTVRGTSSAVINTFTEEVVIISGNPTVRFEGWDGALIEEITVPYGTAATAPTPPEREGYSFVGWDKAIDFVTEDMTVIAVYEVEAAHESSEQKESVAPDASSESSAASEGGGETPAVSACEVTDMTVVYNTATHTLTYTVSYEGALLINQTYIFMLFDGENNLIGAPSVPGSELGAEEGTFVYSMYLADDVVDGCTTPLTGMVRSTAAAIITPYSAEVTYTDDMLLGDVNFDGTVDNLDAAFVLRYDALLISFDHAQLVVGDTNHDGFVDSLDAAAILKHDVGLIVIG